MLEQRSVRREVIGTGENLLVQADGAGALPELDALAGQVQCVYLDPPFMTGERFVRRRRYGAEGWRTATRLPPMKPTRTPSPPGRSTRRCSPDFCGTPTGCSRPRA